MGSIEEGSGRTKEERIHLCESRWHGSQCVNVLERSGPSRLVGIFFSSCEQEKGWLIPLVASPVPRVPWEFLGLRNSPSLGPKYRETRFVCIVWRIDEDSLDGGERLRRVTAGNDPIMVSRDSIRPLSFVIIANSRRSAACYRVNGRARSDPASVFSGFSASLG